MRIRLTRKLAERIDGVDLSRRRVGDVIDLSVHEAHTLIAEGWAVLDDNRDARARHRNRPPADTVADRSPRASRHRHR